MAKRKREKEPAHAGGNATTDDLPSPKKTKAQANGAAPVHIQVITGSYDRVLHGITATLQGKESVEFTDTFLLEAHTSAIRCLALSPPSAATPGQPQKIVLATGGTDERINLYNLSAHAISAPAIPAIPTLTTKPIIEDPANRSLGTLSHHSSSLTSLCFPTRGKLLSAAEDSTIAVTRTRDWSLLTSIKVPIPKAFGRPSGDTAVHGTAPSGVNSFAVHPSLKVMLSVSKGEKCMRLWNLVTGKKAGVLSFERAMLEAVGEGKHATGEGRQVAWGGEEEFAVAFERGLGIWNMDCKIRCIIPMNRAWGKTCRIRYVVAQEGERHLLMTSHEDGCIRLFSTTAASDAHGTKAHNHSSGYAEACLLGVMGGKAVDVQGRIKDFQLIRQDSNDLLIVSGSSDGSVRVWSLVPGEYLLTKQDTPKQIGKLLGTYTTNNRITCIEAFELLSRSPDAEIAQDGDSTVLDDSFATFSEEESSSNSDDSDDSDE